MTAKRNSSMAGALAALACMVFALPAVGKPPGNLVPFPEDLAENAVAEVTPARPQPPKSDFQPRFRPPAVKRAGHEEPAAADDSVPDVQSPDVQPAHAEPADVQPADAEPVREVRPAGAEAAPESRVVDGSGAPDDLPSDGREALDEAYARSKTANTEEDYSAIIQLCRRAKAAGLAKKYEQYSHQLMGWAFNRRGESRAQADNDVDALADFEAAVAASGAWRAIHNRGVSYAGVGRTKEAMADLNRAIQLNPRYPNAYFNRGELRYKEGDFERAIQDYTMAARLGSRESVVYASRGHAYYRMQRFGDALRDYGEAIKLDPANVAALVNRGDTYGDVGRYGEAAKDYKAAVRVAPDNGRAFQAAAWLMATCPDMHYRDEKLAIEAAQRAIELDGPSYRNLSTLAAAQAAASQFGEAQKTQEQAIAAAGQEDKVTAEKMMALYRREIAYRDRPYTAFTIPEEIDDKQVRPAAANEPADPNQGQPAGRRAWFQTPAQDERATQPPSQLRLRRPPSEPQSQAPQSRIFTPTGRI